MVWREKITRSGTRFRSGKEDFGKLRRCQAAAAVKAAGRSQAIKDRDERAATAAPKGAWEKELDEWTHERDPYSLDMIDENGKEKTFSGGEYLHPRQVLRELEKAMPPDVMVSTDIGNINSVANSSASTARDFAA
jgi:sulfoacetaldehyde acetyltransferase